jgi:hypothetical protein
MHLWHRGRIEGEMVSDAQIREVCAKIVVETDPDELDELIAALRMLGTQYVRERSILPADSSPAHQGPNGGKHAA